MEDIYAQHVNPNAAFAVYEASVNLLTKLYKVESELQNNRFICIQT